MSIRNMLLLLVSLLFSGCATDGAYNVAKIAYVGGKQIVVINADLIDADTMAELKKIDRVAITYDGVRTAVKKNIDATEDWNATTITSDTNSTAGGE